ncbi:plant UBX domain-containing protein 11-like isoform X1 [Coffea arabica]|uniref:Plant UBX domain-containing protein 11-like isoform X1 n=1 Tax=Coffea arabica TaxID=13443 RepID=A0A6P6WPG4_COFAR|nr:plant UBX domain-containing protein 11-like isoform X1 [Coffea arabica]
MEQSLSSLTFRGSIMEAIAEAKQQKKLFVVYISGDNPESHNLAASTWMDSRVAESVSKFCIFIHISEGSADAANFSAIYPQKSAPCTTAVGYNGVQLWQYEGFVAADALSSSIEKAWLSVHIQETTATYLSAALASKKQPASGTSDGTSSEEGSSSRTNELSSPAAPQNYSPEVGPSVNPEIVEENNHLECASEQEKLEQLHEATAQSSSANEIACGEVRDGTPTSETAEISINPHGKDPINNEDELVVTEKKVSSHHLEAKEEASSIKITKEGTGANKVEKDDFLKVSANKSNEVHLNIRLPDGSSLQMKFLVMDTLRMVKDYIDENRTSSFGSYDLAIPYPRKVFGEQDLSKTLQDLDLFGRQTLVLVLHHRANWHPKGESSLHDQTNFIRESSSNEGNDGYWGSLRRILSYLNPISYLSGSTNAEDTTAQESQSRIWQYDPNPSLQNDLQGTGISSGAYRSTDTTSRSSNSRSRQLKSSPFGSNIHTLRHDEDDGRFNDRNAFWNGNSTQYGGDNDGK